MTAPANERLGLAPTGPRAGRAAGRGTQTEPLFGANGQGQRHRGLPPASPGALQ